MSPRNRHGGITVLYLLYNTIFTWHTRHDGERIHTLFGDRRSVRRSGRGASRRGSHADVAVCGRRCRRFAGPENAGGRPSTRRFDSARRRRRLGFLVLVLELLNELAHLRVPVVQHPLHLTRYLRRVGGSVHVVVSSLLVVDLLLADGAGLEEPLDGTVRGRSLPVDGIADIVDRHRLVALDEHPKTLPV